MAKARSPIPTLEATEALFLSDHTCCICRQRGKSVQIHHINENPNDHRLENLAVLCFEDHDRTQTRGGFGRHLLAPEVVRYRDDWLDIVALRHKAQAEAVASIDIAANEDQASMPVAFLGPFIESLPHQKQKLFEAAYLGWDSGITSQMNGAALDVVVALEEMWLLLAKWYPANHFNFMMREHYIRAFTASRSSFHRAIHQPQGEGTAGTIIGQLVLGGTMRDLAMMIEDTVEALWFSHELEAIGLGEWRIQWSRAGERIKNG
jgi:hypothetical protein